MLNGTYMTAFGITLGNVESVVAKERGFFEDFGLALEIRGGTGTASAVQAILGRTIDLTRSSGIQSMIAVANEGVPLRSIGDIRQKSQFDLCSMAESPIHSPKELEGKTVGIVSAGGATENLLDMMLLSEGVDPSTVQRPITGVGVAAYELAKAGQIDAWISVDTDRKVINDELGPVHYFNSDEYAKIPSDNYSVVQEFIDSESDIPVRFLAGILKAVEFASDEANWPQVIKDFQVYNPDADTELSLSGLPFLVDSWLAAGSDNVLHMDESAWSSGQELLLRAGIIDQQAPLDQLIYTDYLTEARKLL